jgi:predicted transcriptional regulator
LKKEIRKTLRFSEEEFAKIEEVLTEHNLTFSEFARAAILRKKVKTKLTSDYIFQLQKIGNNLNQIAKSLNQKKDIPNSKILEVLIEIKNDIEISQK